MMEVRCDQLKNLISRDNHAATPLIGMLQGVIVDNHSITPESSTQSREDKLGKRCYKPFLCPLEICVHEDRMSGCV